MSVNHSVLLIAGSPSEQSRSSGLLDWVGERLLQQGQAVRRLNVRDLPSEALVLADWDHPALVRALSQVAQSRVVVVATPIYKAAYSGLLKVFLDLLPQTAFKDKTVLPLATGGSPHHMLALDYALRPVLQSMAASHILPGVYATDAQMPKSPEGAYLPGPDITARLEEAVATLQAGSFRPAAVPVTSGFDPVLLSRVRCSA
jgi:FMN reductase